MFLRRKFEHHGRKRKLRNAQTRNYATCVFMYVLFKSSSPPASSSSPSSSSLVLSQTPSVSRDNGIHYVVLTVACCICVARPDKLQQPSAALHTIARGKPRRCKFFQTCSCCNKSKHFRSTSSLTDWAGITWPQTAASPIVGWCDILEGAVELFCPTGHPPPPTVSTLGLFPVTISCRGQG